MDKFDEIHGNLGLFVRKLPKDVPSSIDIKERARFFMKVLYVGKTYYVPITREMKKIFKISESKGKVLIGYKEGKLLEKFARDIIAGTYLQIRDTIGGEIYSDLSTELKEGLERMFEGKLSAAIDGKMDQKLLPALRTIDHSGR